MFEEVSSTLSSKIFVFSVRFWIMAFKEPNVSEEPYAGWLRYEVEGEKVYYKTPIPRTIIRDNVRLKAYLLKERAQERMLDVSESEFSFKRRLGLRSRKSSESLSCSESVQDNDKEISDYSYKSSSIVDRLTKSGDPIDHKKDLLDS